MQADGVCNRPVIALRPNVPVGPRVDELSHEIDQDSRSVYFQQAAYGVPVRMALIASLLKLHPGLADGSQANRYPAYSHVGGIECSNERCISRNKNERRYLAPKFWIVDKARPILRCVFCDVEQEPNVFGRVSKRKYITEIAEWAEVAPDDLIFFADEKSAMAANYEHRKTRRKLKTTGKSMSHA